MASVFPEDEAERKDAKDYVAGLMRGIRQTDSALHRHAATMYQQLSSGVDLSDPSSTLYAPAVSLDPSWRQKGHILYFLEERSSVGLFRPLIEQQGWRPRLAGSFYVIPLP